MQRLRTEPYSRGARAPSCKQAAGGWEGDDTSLYYIHIHIYISVCRDTDTYTYIHDMHISIYTHGFGAGLGGQG